MLKILFKALVLFLIVLSVYLIIHPQACSNLLAGREAWPVEGEAAEWRHPMAEPQQNVTDKNKDDWQMRDELFLQDSSKENESAQDGTQQTSQPTAVQPQPSYSQEDVDYAIASRYVELEREYARKKPVGKDTATELSYIVMDDFGLTPSEWESFLQRATAADLFEKARRDLPAETAAAPAATPQAAN